MRLKSILSLCSLYRVSMHQTYAKALSARGRGRLLVQVGAPGLAVVQLQLLEFHHAGREIEGRCPQSG